MRHSILTRQSVIALAVLASLLALVTPAAVVAECSPGQQSEANLQFASAQKLLDAKQWSQAIPQLLSIKDFCSEFFPAWRGLGIAYMNTEQLDLAAQAFQKVVALRSATHDVEAGDFAYLARIYTMQKKYDFARAEYVKAQNLEPDNCGVLVNLGILEKAAKQSTRAVTTLERAYNNCEQYRPKIIKQLAEACEQAAAQQRQIGNNEAADLYARKAQQYAVDAGGSTTYDLVRKAMSSGDYAKAVTLCNDILAKDPMHGPALLTKARALDAQDQKAASAEAYQAYLAVSPDDVQATSAMIIVMAEAEQCDVARAEAAKAAKKFESLGKQEMAKVNFAWGKALFCAKDYAQAKVKFQDAANGGDPHWTGPAQEGMNACQEYIDYEARKSAQHGG